MANEVKILDEQPEESAATPQTITTLSCERFIAELAGKAPFPSGAGAAALVGAVAVALGNMIGSARSAEAGSDLFELKYDADVLQADFIWLVSRSCEASNSIAKAFALSEETDEEKAVKNEKLESEFDSAAETALEIMEKCAEAIELIGTFAEKGGKLLLGNAGSAAAMVTAALRAAAMETLTDSGFITDASRVEELRSKTDSLLGQCSAKAERIYGSIFAELNK